MTNGLGEYYGAMKLISIYTVISTHTIAAFGLMQTRTLVNSSRYICRKSQFGADSLLLLSFDRIFIKNLVEMV